jgi:hypothetical protein
MCPSHRRATFNSSNGLLRVLLASEISNVGNTTKRAAAGVLRAILFGRWGSLFEHLIPYPCVSGRRGWPECAETPAKGPGMFKSQQYRAKAAEFGELVKSSRGSDESLEFQKLQQERLAARRDATLGTAALSRWDNEGGAIHEGPPKTI